MKTNFIEFAKDLLGASLQGVVLRIVCAGLAFSAGSVTDIGDAIGLALDKTRAINSCVEIISSTPAPQVVEAIKAENAQ